jgi:hypothetical protein
MRRNAAAQSDVTDDDDAPMHETKGKKEKNPNFFFS